MDFIIFFILDSSQNGKLLPLRAGNPKKFELWHVDEFEESVDSTEIISVKFVLSVPNQFDLIVSKPVWLNQLSFCLGSSIKS